MLTFLETVPTTDPASFLTSYGILGVILMLILTGYLWPKPAVDELKKQHEADRILVLAQHNEERRKWDEEMKPVLVTLLAEVKEAHAVLKTNSNELSEAVRLLEARP